MNELWALLWSKKSNGFHIEPLEQAAKSGMRFFNEAIGNDYLLIAFGAADEMHAKADELRPVVIHRSKVIR